MNLDSERNGPLYLRAKAGALPQLLMFFASAFVVAWAAWIPLFRVRSLPGSIAFIGLVAPALSAVVIAAVFEGDRGVRALVRRLAILRFSLPWGLAAALVMPAIYATAIGALRLLGRLPAGPLFTRNSPAFIVVGFAWLVFVTAGEEIGWRGYALPRLLEQFDRPILISVVLGTVWGLWHLPLYMLPGQSAFPFPLFLIFTSLQSVVYTIVFLRTRGSLLPALLLHAGTDIAPRVFQLAHLPVLFWITVDSILAAVVIVLCLAQHWLTKPD